MTQPVSIQKPVVDWVTVVAIAAIAISITVSFHEGVHALTCLVVGGHLQEYSALHASCDSTMIWQGKVVAGSAPIANLIVGTVFWVILRNSKNQAPELQFFLWLFMLMNWLWGAGYWIFSGIANVGDWAKVIEGWNPHWLWRILLIIVGTIFYSLFVWLGLKELGQMIGGNASEQVQRAKKLGALSYVTAILVVLLAGLFHPDGITGLPAVAGLAAVIGALSPLIWSMRLIFPARSIAKTAKQPLEIHRRWGWIAFAGIVVFTYSFVLGRTVVF